MKFRLKYGGFYLLCFILSLSLGWPAHAADPAISLEQYWQKVEQTRALLADLDTNITKETQAQLLLLANEWDEISQVALPDGRFVPVEHSYLVSQLRATPPDPARLKLLLENLQQLQDRWPQPKHSQADLDPLYDILARSEFQWPAEQPSPLASWLRRLFEQLWNLVSTVMPDDLRLPQASLVRYFLIFLGGLALLLILAFIVRALLIDFVAQAEVESNLANESEMLTADTAFKKAQELSGGGDYRTAVRYLYLSSLLLLDERGLLRYDRSQTNREYLRSVAHLPKLVILLHEVIDVFDRVWYGYQPLDEATYTQYAARVAELHQHR